MIHMVRVFDVFVAIMALVIFSPILAIIPILILLNDGGPVFFSQTRLGKDKHLIRVWKFRTMRDGEITRVGRWLRATALDEYLQFFLILRGKLSTVGPRPLTQGDVTRLGWDDAEHRARWNVIPGITGIVQIYGGTSAVHSWELERAYLANKSLRIDLKIICLSTIANVCGKKRTKNWFPLNRFFPPY